MPIIETEAQLEDALSAPNAADVDFMSRLSGDIVILGAGGKMGPSLAARIKRATDAVGVERRVIAVSRFSAPQSRAGFESAGVETISCDLLDRVDPSQTGLDGRGRRIAVPAQQGDRGGPALGGLEPAEDRVAGNL